MWLNKTQRHFRLTPRCSNMDEWKWWRLRWPSMEFNIAQLLQNVIWYVIIWTGCNTFQGYSVSVCFLKSRVTSSRLWVQWKPRHTSRDAARVRREAVVFWTVAFLCTLDREAKREKLMQCWKKKQKRRRGLCIYITCQTVTLQVQTLWFWAHSS